MEMRFSSRMDGFEPGIFNVLDDRKNQRLIQGRPVYNLSIGTPDFLPEPHVVAVSYTHLTLPTTPYV